MPGRKKETKFDRCLREVKRKGAAVSPGAVCQKSVGRGNKSKRKPTGSHRNRRKPTRRARRNPEAQATESYRDFHGKDPERIITVDTPIRYHGVVAGIGHLKFLEIAGVNGGKVTLRFDRSTYLSENEKRTQLFITGGDQSVNLKAFGISGAHEYELLGEVTEVGYFTEKKHLIEKDGGKATYVHKFQSPRPVLIYDTRNKLLSFAGGGYTIPSEGIDG